MTFKQFLFVLALALILFAGIEPGLFQYFLANVLSAIFSPIFEFAKRQQDGFVAIAISVFAIWFVIKMCTSKPKPKK